MSIQARTFLRRSAVRKVVRKDIEDKVANIIVEADGNISQIDVDADGDEIKVKGK